MVWTSLFRILVLSRVIFSFSEQSEIKTDTLSSEPIFWFIKGTLELSSHMIQLIILRDLFWKRTNPFHDGSPYHHGLIITMRLYQVPNAITLRWVIWIVCYSVCIGRGVQLFRPSPSGKSQCYMSSLKAVCYMICLASRRSVLCFVDLTNDPKNIHSMSAMCFIKNVPV